MFSWTRGGGVCLLIRLRIRPCNGRNYFLLAQNALPQLLFRGSADEQRRNLSFSFRLIISEDE